MIAAVVIYIDQGYPGGGDMSTFRFQGHRRVREEERQQSRREGMRKQTFIACFLCPGAVIRTLHMLLPKC